MSEKLVKYLLKQYEGQWVEITLGLHGPGRSGYLTKIKGGWKLTRPNSVIVDNSNLDFTFTLNDVAQFHVYQFADPTLVIIKD